MRTDRHGGALLETAMFAPVLLMLFIGMVELGRIIFTYYTIEKMMYTAARFVGTQQGANLCDDGDAAVVAAKNLATTGTTDGTADPIVAGLTADQLSLRVERFNQGDGSLSQCECSVTGCDTSQGGLPPDFVVVDLTNGYSVRPLFLKLTVEPFALRPRVRIPYGGT